MDYEYDYGNFTCLTITIEGTMTGVPQNSIVVLARNDFPKDTCEECEQRDATSLFH